MACVGPDGSLTLTARFLLERLAREPMAAPGIAAALKEPLFRIRGRLREMTDAGLIREEGDLFHITEEGKARL